MKKTILFFGMFLSVIQLCQSQNTDSQKVESVGLNLFSFLPFIDKNPTLLFVVEPTIQLNTSKSTPTTKHLVRLSIGYASMNMIRDSRMNQKLSSIYIKAGQHFVGRRVVRGYNVILGHNSLKGKIDIQGNFFPDYSKPLPDESSLTIGAGGYFGTKHKLSKSLYFYWTINSSLNAGSVGSPRFSYIPGAGNRVFQGPFAIDFNLHLMYHFSKNTFGHSL